jgi:hypothetical protein
LQFSARARQSLLAIVGFEREPDEHGTTGRARGADFGEQVGVRFELERQRPLPLQLRRAGLARAIVGDGCGHDQGVGRFELRAESAPERVA